MIILQSEKSQNNYHWIVGKFTPEFTENPANFLCVTEQEYLQQMTHGKRRNEYLQTRFVLKSKLAEILKIHPTKIEFTTQGEGKPVLANADTFMDFNISHSHDYYAIVLSTAGQVGIDIEKYRDSKTLVAVAKRFFSSYEADLIAAQTEQEKQTRMFTKIWAGKEAIIKTVASGVLKSAGEILMDEQTWKIKKLPADFGELHSWEVNFIESIPDYICSVAFKKTTP